jgi:hypothetical protein
MDIQNPMHFLVTIPLVLAEVLNAVQMVEATARSLWPCSRTVLFGSQATGLSLPGADLDIVVLGVGAQLTRAASGFHPEQVHGCVNFGSGRGKTRDAFCLDWRMG